MTTRKSASALIRLSHRSLATAAKRNAMPALSGTKLDPSESFLTGTNANVLEEMFEKYSVDPRSVHPSWSMFFQNLEAGAVPGQAVALTRINRNKLSSIPASMTAGRDLFTVSEDTIKLMSMIRAYRHRGHLLADVDPLNLSDGPHSSIMKSNELEPAYYGFTDGDLDREFVVSGELPGPPVRRLREVVNIMRKAYCGKIGVEYRHMLSYEEKVWIASFLESDLVPQLTAHEKREILQDLAEGELFEYFLSRKHSTAKRFGLEGGESLIPGLQAMIDRGSQLGVENVILGMPHRGRLNVLANVAGKSKVQIFREFLPHDDPYGDTYLGSGDVKYHLGTSSARKMRSGNTVKFSLLANPSHLEAVDPVAVGKTRAKQFFTGDHERKRTMALLLHGDASFAGQGVVAETLELSDLRDYTTGGTVHVVVNNQIGFTTDPRYARSSAYPTDVAKTVGVPIFHVNGDCPESVVKVCRMAMEYRQRFQKDVVIDLICYRRHGHNELDQPMFTQPKMYKKIKTHKTPLEIYGTKLVKEGVISEEEFTKTKDEMKKDLQQMFETSKDWKPDIGEESFGESSDWAGYYSESTLSKPLQTGVDLDRLRDIGLQHVKIPDNFRIHPALKKIMGERKHAIELGQGIDWGTAEALAFGSLLVEGTTVRLSGQDVERGTFSHRHAVWHNQEQESVYVPLNNLNFEDQAYFQVCNSNLSEMAVLGFEVGYSLESPSSLILWEGQFGDFANGAQVIIDTFIAAGERKWRRQSGITLLLPHGYEGQGPEHSSARLERFLQMCDDDPDEIPHPDPEKSVQIQTANWQVVNASTPANYFHVLRRQVHRQFRKPLVMMSPKSLLRLPACKSPLSEFRPGTMFEQVIPDKHPALAATDSVRKVVFCTGKVYYELERARASREIDDVALVRVEQIAPFPFHMVAEQAAMYPNAEVSWAQEESMNMGAWSYVQPRFASALSKVNGDNARSNIEYYGRKPSASPATGYSNIHKKEQEAIINEVLS